jgi:hypothetical protein
MFAVERSPGLPDGIFSNQKSKFEKILEGLGMENVDLFFCHLDFFIPFVIFYRNLVNFVVIITRFGMFYQEKSGNPGILANIM